MSDKKIKSDRQLKIGAALSYLAIGINIISALIYSPWMLSKIGSGDYGLYTLATSLINMFLIDFGISSAVSRFVSKYVAEGRQDKVDQLLGVVFKLFGGLSCGISVILIGIYFFIDQIYLALTPVELVRFKVVYIISAAFSVVSFPFSTTLNGILTSYEKFIQMKLCDVGNKVFTVLFIVIALLTGGGLYELVAINAALNLVCFAAKWIVIKTTTKVNVNLKCWDVGMLKEIFGFSMWVLINSICSRLIMNICPNILGITAGTMAITIFSFASVIEGYTYTFASAIDGMFVPRIARITYGERDMNKILLLMIKVGRFQYHLVGLIIVGFACVGKMFITLWIGEEYMSVYYGALLLMLPAPFYLSQQIGKSTMVMVNKVRYLTVVNVIKAAANVVLVSLLSRPFGSVGACMSICIVYFFRNFANSYLYKTQLGIDMKQFNKECYGKMSLAIIAALMFGMCLGLLPLPCTWFVFLCKVVLIGISYIVFMWLLGYNENEKRMVYGIIKKLFFRMQK